MHDLSGAVWRKSSFSGSGNACVEVADLPTGGQAVRDSKLGNDSPVLWFTTAEVAALAAECKAGRLGR